MVKIKNIKSTYEIKNMEYQCYTTYQKKIKFFISPKMKLELYEILKKEIMC